MKRYNDRVVNYNLVINTSVITQLREITPHGKTEIRAPRQIREKKNTMMTSGWFKLGCLGETTNIL